MEAVMKLSVRVEGPAKKMAAFYYFSPKFFGSKIRTVL